MERRREGVHPMIPDTLRPMAVSIDSVIPYPRNPRVGDIQAIKASLNRFGQMRPIVVQQSTGYVLAGNHVYHSARELGWPDIAVAPVDVSDEMAKAYVLADNRLSDLGRYEDGMLAELLQEQPDLDGTGYSQQDVQKLLAGLDKPLDLPDAEVCPECGKPL